MKSKFTGQDNGNASFNWSDDTFSDFSDVVGIGQGGGQGGAKGSQTQSGHGGTGSTFAPENVTLAGSNLTFSNTYASTVTAAYHTAVLAAEHEFESHLTGAIPVTITVNFGFQNLGSGFLAQNSFNNTASVSYSALRSALAQHETTADDISAVNSLPVNDPSGSGHAYLIGSGMARLLGLGGSPGSNPDVNLVLGTGVTWDFDSSNGITAGAFDAIGAIEHEISEGGLGRVGGLGIQNHTYAPMDLFRFSSAGHRDFTGGQDGLSTFFSVDNGSTLLTPFHNSVSTNGTFDGQDFADWNIGGDSFGFGKPGTAGVLSTIDLRVLDILGWTPTGSSAPPPADDFANSFTDVTHPFGHVTVNHTSTGNLEVQGDHDWFAVTLSANTSYVVSLQGQQGGGGTLSDPLLTVYNNGGAQLAQNDDITLGVNLDSQLTFTSTTAGTYYLEASSFNDQFAGTYRIGVTGGAPTDDFANSFTDVAHPFGTVAVNGASAGNLEVLGDRDWFAVTLSAGATYLINLQGQQAGGGTLLDPYLRVHDSSGALLVENDDINPGVNRDSQLTFVAANAGTYYIEAGAYDESYKGTYTVRVNQTTPADDYRDSLTDTGVFGQIVVNTPNTGILEVAGDRDWFAVQLTAGVTYEINLQGQDGGGGTLLDPFLHLRDSSGTLLAENDDIDPGVIHDSQLNFTAGTAGTYYLDVGAYFESYAGTYRVSVISDDYRNSFADVTHPFGAVSLNGSSTGNLEEAGDRDWFSVQLVTGERYVINLQGAHSGGGTLLDPFLSLYSDDGTFQLSNDDIKLNSNPDSQLVVTIDVGGTFYIEAGAFNDASSGTYTVSLANVTITGTSKNDTINGMKTVTGQLKPDAGTDFIFGLGGNDVISGLGGADHIDGGLGTDTSSYATDTVGVAVSLIAGTANGGEATGDVLISIENLTGGSGDDTLEGDSGNNVLIGGANSVVGDTASYAHATAGVNVSLALTKAQATGGAGTDTISGFENLTGSAFDDVLAGNAGANHLDGGGHGADTVSYAASKAGVIVDLKIQDNATAQTSTGDANGDILHGFANVIGSAKADVLTGDVNDNVIEGGAGADQLHGGGGSDTVSYAGSKTGVTVTLGAGGELNTNGGSVAGGDAAGDTGDGFENIRGSARADRLTGNAGDNIITGGAGIDTLTGGAGNDRFAYQDPTHGGDTIADFGNGSDAFLINKVAFGGNLTSQGGTPDTHYFVSAAGHAATEAHGQLLFDTALHQLFWDDDGTAAHAAVLIATLANNHNLTAAEVILV